MTHCPDLITLAELVATMPVDRWPDTTCVVWVDSADRWCGRDRATGLLCTRHHNTAIRRWERQQAEAPARAARQLAARQAASTRARPRLAKVEAQIAKLTPTEHTTDSAVINTPLRSRMPSDTRITQLARLHAEREELARIVEAGR